MVTKSSRFGNFSTLIQGDSSESVYPRGPFKNLNHTPLPAAKAMNKTNFAFQSPVNG
jgi:hypothetical protein